MFNNTVCILNVTRWSIFLYIFVSSSGLNDKVTQHHVPMCLPPRHLECVDSTSSPLSCAHVLSPLRDLPPAQWRRSCQSCPDQRVGCMQTTEDQLGEARGRQEAFKPVFERRATLYRGRRKDKEDRRKVIGVMVISMSCPSFLACHGTPSHLHSLGIFLSVSTGSTGPARSDGN